jgi:N-formylmaleamate deformylase
MNDPQKANAMLELTGRSDPEAVAEYIMEMLPADLRPDLGKAKAPILVLVATDSYKKGLSDEAIRAFYQRVLANAPRASIILTRNARHFMMVDQPEAIAAAIGAFLAGLDLQARM